MIKKNETFSLLKFLGLGLILDIKNWLSSREGKIPENSTFVPAPKYKFFRGFSPQNPQALDCPPSPPHPRGDFRGFSPKNSWPYGCPRPRPVPVGILGDSPKIPKNPRKIINTILPSRCSHLARPSSVRVQFKFKFKPFQSTGQQNWIVPITVH